MTRYPKVQAVKPLQEWRLLVTFENGRQKIYDCNPLLANEAFDPLNSQALFKSVQVDRGGYGVSWNEDIDLSEAELWEQGTAVSPSEEKVG
jgi:hypothetical protein